MQEFKPFLNDAERFFKNMVEIFLFLGNKVNEPLHNVSVLIKKNRALESAQIS